jgi:DNA-binding GntR family transcriptional regulator
VRHSRTGDPAARATLVALDGASMKGFVVDALRDAIVAGTLSPGEKLSEARLAQRFGVSRTPVREALKQLEAERLVSIERRRGTFVKQFTRREVIELYDVRAALEGMAARLCAERRSEECAARVRQAYSRMSDAVDRDDASGFLREDQRLHELIFEGAGNDRLTEHYRLLDQHMQRQLLGRIVTSRAGRMRRSLHEHVPIIVAVERGDGEAAESAMRAHVVSGRHELAVSLVGGDQILSGTPGDA